MLDQGVPRRGRDGVFTGYIGCCLDVESMKQAQEDNRRLLAAAEQAREEADAASRAKDVFLATVSHELRNPLNAIVGWAHVLRNDGASPEDVQRGAAVIAQSAQAQVRLIEELLDVSRVITGTMRLNRRPCDLREIVLAAVHAHQPAATAKRLALEVEAGPVPVTFGDADRLRQVVTNLVSNAVSYTPRGGRACVELRVEGDELVLRVSDSGIGIDPDFLPHVFEAFRQSGDRRGHSGLGLGLSVVRHLVRMHGGRVAAASDGPGHGAEFIVRLPVAAAPADFVEESDSGPYPALPDPLRGKRVLVVDDDTAALQLLEKWLSDRDAVVLTAGSAREALKAAPRFRPEIVLSDIQMPGGDGYELIRELRKLPPSQGGTAPAAALTAFAGEADHRSLLEAGFQAHLTKPIEPDTLFHELARLVRQ
jgi:CheY-like chemotaxis protein/nitrogen-specific signal transduction histidine kinase